MNNSFFRIIALLLCASMVISLAACGGADTSSDQGSLEPSGDISSTDSSSTESGSNVDQAINDNAMADKIQNKEFPMFKNTVDYTRGGATATEEAYQDYKKYTQTRHEFKDMIGHDSEVAAVRLAELGIFSKGENFKPDSSMTVGGFLKALMMACRQDIKGSTSNADLKKFIDSTNFLEEGVTVDYEAVLTNEQLAYFLSRTNEAVSNAAQYKLMISDYNSIDAKYREGVLQTVAVGITEVKNFKFSPKSAAKRSDIADGIYRLINTGARIIPLYDLGNLYAEGENEYLVKTQMAANEGGMQFGFFANYNRQPAVFENFGKLTIDRTGFNKWYLIEKEQGVYSWPAFTNDAAPHKVGNTSIICVDISANLRWNSSFGKSNIPSFYEQDITNKKTRSAAKRFLYNFVQQMLAKLDGDVILLIDYELDWQQALYDTAAGRNRAIIFSEWFVEACTVAREAARAAGKGDKLQLGVNYNNITNLHLKGVKENQWMLDMAKAVDFVTIDSYNFYDDQTDPSYTVQNIRYLMNNYSLGKPVIVVENGLGMLVSGVKDKVTGLSQEDLVASYYEKLFREFRFSLEKGDFLNKNLSGFLIWSYFDTENKDKNYGVANSDNTLRKSGKTLLRGYELLMKQKQFNPSYVSKVSEASVTPPEITVKSGTEYEKLTYIITDYDKDKGEGMLRIKLSTKGTVMITVNGETHMVSASNIDSHAFEIKGLRDGFNCIDIYFGAEQANSVRTVEKVLFY